MAKPVEITRMLRDLKTGDKALEARLVEAIYPELRRLAGRYLRRERAGHTLQATALVNEAYLRIAGETGREWQDRYHFFAFAANLIRRILVDYARERKALKRDGGQRVELTDNLAIAGDRLDEITAISDALDRLAEWDPRQSRVVELRFFGGLTETETAEILGIALRTVRRDWSLARAWLYGELNAEAEASSISVVSGRRI